MTSLSNLEFEIANSISKYGPTETKITILTQLLGSYLDGRPWPDDFFIEVNKLFNKRLLSEKH